MSQRIKISRPSFLMQKTGSGAAFYTKTTPKPYCISDGIHKCGSPLFQQAALPDAYGGRDQKEALEMPKKETLRRKEK